MRVQWESGPSSPLDLPLVTFFAIEPILVRQKSRKRIPSFFFFTLELRKLFLKLLFVKTPCLNLYFSNLETTKRFSRNFTRTSNTVSNFPDENRELSTCINIRKIMCTKKQTDKQTKNKTKQEQNKTSLVYAYEPAWHTLMNQRDMRIWLLAWLHHA